jgi:hypothetical protein
MIKNIHGYAQNSVWIFACNRGANQMKLSLEEWQEQYFIPTSKLLEDIHLDFPGLNLTGIDMSEDVDLMIKAEYNSYLEKDILSFDEWKKEYFRPSEELAMECTSMFQLDIIQELETVLKMEYDAWLKGESLIIDNDSIIGKSLTYKKIYTKD